MFERLFGATDIEQLHYLQVRVIISIISVAVDLLFMEGAIFTLIMMFVWGWAAAKALFGITTIGVIFSRDLFTRALLFALYATVSCACGLFCAALGFGRYIYLLIKRAKGLI
ncbi:MAG: hypothetical protein IJP07_02140 [Firmicutes bacterium]|nr:hypothetical protein [Bacillota bacterium]